MQKKKLIHLIEDAIPYLYLISLITNVFLFNNSDTECTSIGFMFYRFLIEGFLIGFNWSVLIGFLFYLVVLFVILWLCKYLLSKRWGLLPSIILLLIYLLFSIPFSLPDSFYI